MSDEKRDHIPVREFRQVLQEMQLLSYGTTGSFEGRVTGSKERPLLPAGELEPMFEEFEKRWQGARSVRAKWEVYEAAKGRLRAWTHSSRPPVDSEAWREMVATAEGSAQEVAAKWNISASRVYQIRKAYQRKAA